MWDGNLARPSSTQLFAADKIKPSPDLEVAAMTLTATQISFEDYLTHDDADNRYELVDGKLVLMNPPEGLHLLIADLLDTHFKAEIQRSKQPWRSLREAGVRTGANKSRLTDLCIVTTEQLREVIHESAIFQSPPLLIVEIVSPDSIKRDYRYKRSEYAALEVPEYWIVDPLEVKVTVLSLEEGLYEEVIYAGDQQIRSQIFLEQTLTVEQVFAAGELGSSKGMRDEG
jgi:Uma2 family endonuclease